MRYMLMFRRPRPSLHFVTVDNLSFALFDPAQLTIAMCVCASVFLIFLLRVSFTFGKRELSETGPRMLIEALTSVTIR